MNIYRLPIDEVTRLSLKTWLVKLRDENEGDDRDLIVSTHAGCVTECEAVELPSDQMHRLYVLLEGWGLQQKSTEVKRAVGHLCSRICECLRLPPYRVVDDAPEVVAEPVADRQRSLF